MIKDMDTKEIINKVDSIRDLINNEKFLEAQKMLVGLRKDINFSDEMYNDLWSSLHFKLYTKILMMPVIDGYEYITKLNDEKNMDENEYKMINSNIIPDIKKLINESIEKRDFKYARSLINLMQKNKAFNKDDKILDLKLKYTLISDEEYKKMLECLYTKIVKPIWEYIKIGRFEEAKAQIEYLNNSRTISDEDYKKLLSILENKEGNEPVFEEEYDCRIENRILFVDDVVLDFVKKGDIIGAKKKINEIYLGPNLRAENDMKDTAVDMLNYDKFDESLKKISEMKADTDDVIYIKKNFIIKYIFKQIKSLNKSSSDTEAKAKFDDLRKLIEKYKNELGIDIYMELETTINREEWVFYSSIFIPKFDNSIMKFIEDGDIIAGEKKINEIYEKHKFPDIFINEFRKLFIQKIANKYYKNKDYEGAKKYISELQKSNKITDKMFEQIDRNIYYTENLTPFNEAFDNADYESAKKILDDLLESKKIGKNIWTRLIRKIETYQAEALGHLIQQGRLDEASDKLYDLKNNFLIGERLYVRFKNQIENASERYNIDARPRQQRSLSPPRQQRYRSPSPPRQRSPSPPRRRSRSPPRRRSRSPSPLRRRSPSPLRRRIYPIRNRQYYRNYLYYNKPWRHHVDAFRWRFDTRYFPRNWRNWRYWTNPYYRNPLKFWGGIHGYMHTRNWFMANWFILYMIFMKYQIPINPDYPPPGWYDDIIPWPPTYEYLYDQDGMMI